jgi:hypothetical protein
VKAQTEKEIKPQSPILPMAPAPSITQPDKKTILKNAINQNEQIEKQSVIDGEGDKTSLENMIIYNDSIDGTPPPSQQNKTRTNAQTKNAPSKLNTTRAQDANTQPQPHQPFPFPKKNLAKEKNAIAAAKNNTSKKSTTTDKENEQQKQQSKSNSNAKNLALKVINKEASVTSFKEDDQV